jgi:hypothetical protein
MRRWWLALVSLAAGTALAQQPTSKYYVGLDVGNYQLNPRMRVRLDWEQNDQLSFGLNMSGGAGVYDLGQSSLTSLGLDYRF